MGWADMFWRRRHSHQKRPDPEIPFLQTLRPKSILEIGCAYGRFTHKLLELNDTSLEQVQVTGIELNPAFESYTQRYSSDYPNIKQAKFIYANILEANTLFSKEAFETIVIPMHTFPGFSKAFIEKLLPVIRYLLTENGHCIFSVHKTYPTMRENTERLTQVSYGGELLVEPGENLIGSIYYVFPANKKEYGYSRISYGIIY